MSLNKINVYTLFGGNLEMAMEVLSWS